jgi:hypothetical protein
MTFVCDCSQVKGVCTNRYPSKITIKTNKTPKLDYADQWFPAEDVLYHNPLRSLDRFKRRPSSCRV